MTVRTNLGANSTTTCTYRGKQYGNLGCLVAWGVPFVKDYSRLISVDASGFVWMQDMIFVSNQARLITSHDDNGPMNTGWQIPWSPVVSKSVPGAPPLDVEGTVGSGWAHCRNVCPRLYPRRLSVIKRQLVTACTWYSVLPAVTPSWGSSAEFEAKTRYNLLQVVEATFIMAHYRAVDHRSIAQGRSMQYYYYCPGAGAPRYMEGGDACT